MGKFAVKVYIVQKADRSGVLGEILATKLTFEAAHEIAKIHAPAKVHMCVADKTTFLNGPDHEWDHAAWHGL